MLDILRRDSEDNSTISKMQKLRDRYAGVPPKKDAPSLNLNREQIEEILRERPLSHDYDDSRN